MLLNEVATKTGMTKRAVKFYEQEGLLTVKKDVNGYRNYSDEDVDILEKISLYRKLGIGISDIKTILKNNNEEVLKNVYLQKLREKKLRDREIKALKDYIDSGDINKAHSTVDYRTIYDAFDCLLPGEWSDYFKNHFAPFLDIKIYSREQKQAFNAIINYCDETVIQFPFIAKLGMKLAGGVPKPEKTAEEMTAYYRDMDEDQYNDLKNQVLKGVKIKTGIMKYHPLFAAQRKIQKELQNKGYNDIFIPNMMILSPAYAEYKTAMDKINSRITTELGLHYDTNYNLVIRK